MTDQRRPSAGVARRSETSRRAVLTAAFELAAEVGYAKLSIEGIAARAGVGKQTIYRWWPSKGAVLFDAFLMFAAGEPGGGVGGEGGGEPGEEAALPDTGDIEADLKTVMFATVDELNDPRYDRTMRALSIEIAHDADLAALYAERLDRPMRELKKRRLRAAQEAGQLAAGLDLDVAVDLLWSPLLVRWLHREGPLTHEYAAALVETALGGMRP
ncbi:TetR/AcrR family transcriptional regulator [Streptosporangium pseudovulgare]|uniref:TetR family transcriptional regulator n=1 Tax=Streptosporangium pseudovulgare TaxID=35765 RepID=A0ABQ2R0W2_9ACTN|nr:TetR/AcrR family transcriptional regulator [Streptosporangium pseudovulgare]GGQ04294.1 TetR family transcriptional regulator [Streptosporangium pseudovulgare]